jgi:hypothetical protein
MSKKTINKVIKKVSKTDEEVIYDRYVSGESINIIADDFEKTTQEVIAIVELIESKR